MSKQDNINQGFPGPCDVLSLTNATGANFIPILLILRHSTPNTLCCSIERNTDSRFKGMVLFDQGGGGEGGGERGKGYDLNWCSRQSAVRLFYVVVCAKDVF